MKYVRLVLALGLAMLMTPRLGAQVDVTPAYAPDELLVKFERDVSPDDATTAIVRVGGSIIERFDNVPNLYLIKLPAGLSPLRAVSLFAAERDTVYAEPNYSLTAFVTPNDPSFGDLWGLHNTGQSGGTTDVDVDAPEAWDITTGSSNVVVAVVDTGIDYNHPDLAANMYRNEADCNANGVDDDGNGYRDDCYGIDTFNNDSDPFDDNRHGTHVAGTIGAVGNNGVGVAGVNWNVKLMACKFLGASGSGSTAGAVSCLNYLATMKDRGVNIVATNNSWGGGGFSQSLLDAIDAQRQRGILFIAAAGNAALDNDTNDVYPANYYLPNIISVGSLTRTGALSSFSDFGRNTVHVGAPGSEILSTTPGNGYQTLSGTSMATPHVTGVTALLKAQDANRDWRAIRNLVLAGGDDSTALSDTSVTGKRLNARGGLTCSNRVVRSRLQPTGSTPVVNIGDTVAFAVLHINCALPNGDVSVTVKREGGHPSSQEVSLLDNGVAPDQVAGDGVYSGQLTFSTYGVHTVTFPGGDVVSVQVLRTYHYQTTTFEYRDFTGTSLALALDSTKVLDTPFPVRFGGGSFSKLHISPNGVAGISAPHIAFINASIPVSSKKAFVAAFWDDLYPATPTSANDHNVFWTVLGTTPNRELVIEWRNLPHFACLTESSVGVKFQLVFFERSSRVLMNYADTVMGGSCTTSDRGGSASIGIQVAGGRGTERSFNLPIIENNTALLWTSAGAFTDGSLTGVPIKAVHITELRDRIDVLRTAHGVAAFKWTELSAGITVTAVHFQELRTALNEAYTAAQKEPPTYTDPTIISGVTPVKAIHIIELRSAVSSLE